MATSATLQFVIEKAQIERGVMDDQFGTAHKFQKAFGDIGKARLVGEKIMRQTMHLHRVGIDGAIRLQIGMKTLPGDPSIEQFDAANLDHPMALRRIKTGGFRIQNKLPFAHALNLFA